MTTVATMIFTYGINPTIVNRPLSDLRYRMLPISIQIKNARM